MNALKAILLCLVLATALSGCWMFQRQEVLLDPQQVAELESKIGRLNQQNMQEWIEGASLATHMDVEAIRKTQEGILVTLSAPIQEAGVEAGTTLLSTVGKNPTQSGIIAGIPAVLFALISVLNKRAQLKAKKEAKNHG